MSITHTIEAPQKLTRAATVSLYRDEEIDFDFLKELLFVPDTPEYHGFNTRFCREAGMIPAKKSAVKFMHLINQTIAQ